jgi:hypothetical protein
MTIVVYTDVVSCLHTLMNSLNEVISVHFCATTNVSMNRQSPKMRKLTPKLSNPPRPLKILQKKFWGNECGPS